LASKELAEAEPDSDCEALSVCLRTKSRVKRAVGTQAFRRVGRHIGSAFGTRFRLRDFGLRHNRLCPIGGRHSLCYHYLSQKNENVTASRLFFGAEGAQ